MCAQLFSFFVFEQRHVKDFIAPYKHLFMLAATLPGTKCMKLKSPPDSEVFF